MLLGFCVCRLIGGLEYLVGAFHFLGPQTDIARLLFEAAGGRMESPLARRRFQRQLHLLPRLGSEHLYHRAAIWSE